MPDTLTRAGVAPAQATDLDPSRSEPVEGAGWILPATGAVALTLIWGAYVLMFIAEMLKIPAP